MRCAHITASSTWTGSFRARANGAKELTRCQEVRKFSSSRTRTERHRAADERVVHPASVKMSQARDSNF